MKDKSIGLEIKKIDSLIVRKIMACNKDSLCQLTPVQIVVIKYLIKNKNSIVYQKDIEKKLGLRKSTVSGILGTMIKNGIIIRTDSSNDLRSKEIRLTETGYWFVQFGSRSKMHKGVGFGRSAGVVCPRRSTSYSRSDILVYRNIDAFGGT